MDNDYAFFNKEQIGNLALLQRSTVKTHCPKVIFQLYGFFWLHFTLKKSNGCLKYYAIPIEFRVEIQQPTPNLKANKIYRIMY